MLFGDAKDTCEGEHQREDPLGCPDLRLPLGIKRTLEKTTMSALDI